MGELGEKASAAPLSRKRRSRFSDQAHQVRSIIKITEPDFVFSVMAVRLAHSIPRGSSSAVRIAFFLTFSVNGKE